MIEYFVKKKERIEKISECVAGCLINVLNPSDKEIKFLVEELELNKDMIIQGLDIYEEPRFEDEDKKVYIFMTTTTEKLLHDDISSFLVVYSKKHIIIISKYNLEVTDNVVSNGKIEDFSSSKNLIRILYFISKAFETAVHKIMRDVKADKTDLNKLKEKDIAKLIVYENKLNSYVTPFGEMVQSYSKILKMKLIEFSERDSERLENLIIDLNETLNICKSTLKTITNMRNYYSTQLSTNLNRIVTALTIFTIFLTIPTLVSSVYGMNINLPFQNSPNIFINLIIVVLVIWVVMFSFLKFAKII